jgi:hypothetical protein
MLRVPIHRPRRAHPFLFGGVIFVVLLVFWSWPLLRTTWTLLDMPFRWDQGGNPFMISPEPIEQGGDAFDITFASYDQMQPDAGAGFEDRIPAVMHHISLGSGKARDSKNGKWEHARQSCLDMHPGWKEYMWTDDNAEKFVAEKFPELMDMWMSYRYPIQKIDALRYMVLHEYGGKCWLRRRDRFPGRACAVMRRGLKG